MSRELEQLKRTGEITDYERVHRSGLTQFQIDADNRLEAMSALDDALPQNWKIATQGDEIYVWDRNQSSTAAIRSW